MTEWKMGWRLSMARSRRMVMLACPRFSKFSGGGAHTRGRRTSCCRNLPMLFSHVVPLGYWGSIKSHTVLGWPP